MTKNSMVNQAPFLQNNMDSEYECTVVLPPHTTLYTTPPQASQPLTAQEFEAIIARRDYQIYADRARYIVQMTEQAHGIAAQKGQPKAVHQFRKGKCADWYDGHPDHQDGGGPYEERTLYTAPTQQPLTKKQIDDLLFKYGYDADDEAMHEMIKEANGTTKGTT